MTLVVKHSRLGIGAFVLSMVAAVGLLVDILLMHAWRQNHPIPAGQGFGNEIYFIYAGAPLLMGSILAFGLGLAGALRRTRKRIFGLLAMFFGALPFVVILLIK